MELEDERRKALQAGGRSLPILVRGVEGSASAWCPVPRTLPTLGSARGEKVVRAGERKA
jgi:hypothetical protein